MQLFDSHDVVQHVRNCFSTILIDAELVDLDLFHAVARMVADSLTDLRELVVPHPALRQLDARERLVG